jgi:hypothetical protein
MERRYAHQWSPANGAEGPVRTEIKFSIDELLATIGCQAGAELLSFTQAGSEITLVVDEHLDHSCALGEYRQSPGPSPWSAHATAAEN